MKEKGSQGGMIAVAVLLLLLPPALYVGSYLLLLDPLEVNPPGHEIVVSRAVQYRTGIYSGAAEGFYGPVHWLDQKIRPSYWDGDW